MELLTLLISGLVFKFSSAADTSSFIDPNYVTQENFHGWGTTLAWWADYAGGLEDEEYVNEIVDDIFSPDKLGFNIVRYVIGGTNPSHSCGGYRPGGASESFKDSLEADFNWNRDLRQRKILLMAKEKGVDVFEAFSNSPPEWLTISGCSKGNPSGAPLHSNFHSWNSDDFADYSTTVIQYFHDHLNITFTSYSPFNEPYGLHGIGGWVGQIDDAQEGCNMELSTMVAVIQAMHRAKLRKGLDFLKISVSDETQINTQVQVLNYFEKEGVLNLTGQINTHVYWDKIEVSRRDVLSLMAARNGLELWMDEMCFLAGPPEGIEQGVQTASHIVLDLREMMPSAWIYWQIIADIGEWGHTRQEGNNVSEYNSGYYGIMQFSKHIRRGYKLIFISDVNSVAALSPDEDKLVIVTVNPGITQLSHEFDLSLFSSIDNIKVWRTSENENHTSLEPPKLREDFRLEVVTTLKSITTIEMKVSLTESSNLIENGDFETTTSQAWTNVGDGTGVSNELVWRGKFSGYFETGKGFHKISQNFTITEQASCEFYLVAWCSSNVGGTRLGVKINGRNGPQMPIQRDGVYRGHGIHFPASFRDVVEIYFENDGSELNGMAKIDNVVLKQNCDKNEGAETTTGNGVSKIEMQSVMLVLVPFFCSRLNSIKA